MTTLHNPRISGFYPMTGAATLRPSLAPCAAGRGRMPRVSSNPTNP